MEVFKIGIRNHLKNSGSITTGLVSGIIFPLGLGLIADKNPFSYSWISIVIFIVMVIPAVYIHIIYYLVNRGDVLKYDFQAGEIIFEHKGTSSMFNLSEIKYIERFISFNLEVNRACVIPCDEYNYSIICFEDGKKITITSLLVPNLNLPIENEKVVVKRNMFLLLK